MALEGAIDYYQLHLVEKSMRRDLSDFRSWLPAKEPDEPAMGTSQSRQFTKILDQASNVYRREYWPIHNAFNAEVLDYQLETIRTFEAEVISGMQN